ncbi:MAG: matrixin family metalloprotease [Gammaproteobacteria bacterium]|nr:matrixin family metalloprotease [Gammaproteobacteria bacterium]
MHPTSRHAARLAFLAATLVTAEAPAYSLSQSAPGKWGDPAFGTGAVISYSLMGAGLDTGSGRTSVDFSTFMPGGFEDDIRSAFAAWSAVANLGFVEALDPGVGAYNIGADAVNIRISGVDYGPTDILADAFFPPSFGGSGAGDLHFNSQVDWRLNSDAGTGISVYLVAVHEIGHALGLHHPGCGSSPACPDLGPYGSDPLTSRLMSPTYNVSLIGPQRDDIAGIQHLYGPPTGAVPVPGSLVLFASTLGFLAGARRRQRLPR